MSGLALPRSPTRYARYWRRASPQRGNLDLHLLSRPGLPPERLRPLWLQHRDAILPAWIEERPGRRPFGWWYAGDAPEPRWLLQADPATTCAIRRRAWGVEPLQPDIRCVVESQAAFLRRLHLLPRAEAVRLTAADFAPILLEPDEDEREDDEHNPT